MTVRICRKRLSAVRTGVRKFLEYILVLKPDSGPGLGITLGLVLGLVYFALTPPCAAESLTISEGLQAVTSRSYDVRIAEARRQSAALAEDVARSRMRPQVNAYADHTWLENRPEAIFGTGSSPLSEDHFLRYGVTVRQTITDFGRTSADVQSARAAALAQTGLAEQVRNSMALEFVQAYVSLLKAENTLDVAEQEVKRFKAHADDAKALYDAGEVTRSDVLASEVALSDALQRQITARDGRELAASRVNFLILRPLDQPLQVENFISPLAGNPDMDELMSAAEASRPEIRILDEQIAAREAELRLQENNRYPVVFVSAGYSYEENPYRVYEDNWSAVLGMTWDLYTGGARPAGQSRAVQELSAVVTERERMEEKIRLEVTEALLLFNGATERIDVAEKTLNQAEENLRLQKVRYQEGEASATDVIDTVTAFTKAQNNHWSAVHDRQTAEALVLFTTGTELQDAYKTASLSGRGAAAGTGELEKNDE